jgi:hypothetical protein
MPDRKKALIAGATPLPAALPLFATGIAGLGLLGWRRRRKTASASYFCVRARNSVVDACSLLGASVARGRGSSPRPR